MEYKSVLDKYSFIRYSIFSSINEEDWGDREKAEEYLEKYGMPSTLYESNWAKAHNSIFNLNKQLPDMIFKKDFEFVSLLGGVMFEERDFEQFKSCIRKIGERSFAVVQDTYGFGLKQLSYSLNMNYPIDISWEELMSGNFISAVLFEYVENDYYLFGNSEEWGMYVANEYIDESVSLAGNPIRIIGFDKGHRDTFRETFEIPDGQCYENLDYIPEEERPNLKEWVPPLYQN